MSERDVYVKGWKQGMRQARNIVRRAGSTTAAVQEIDRQTAAGLEAERRAALADGNAATRARHA